MLIYAFLMALYYDFGVCFFRYYFIVRYMRYPWRRLCWLRFLELARTRRFADW
jgi:hypothetical protein